MIARQTQPTNDLRHGFAALPVGVTAAAVMLALALTSGRYGYHRDELYFIAAGAHPALGYPDQPLLTPLLAHAMNSLAPRSLSLLRAPAVLASGLTVVLTGLLARELGGTRRAQWIASLCWAVGAVCIVTGHFLSTTTWDICATAAMSSCVARAMRTGDPRWWVATGAVVGLGLLNKSIVGVVAGFLVGAIALVGPREILRSRWLAVGAALAVIGGLPYAIWQLQHGLPQTDLARSIAANGAEGGRIGFIPFQLLLIGPLVAPVWLAGLWDLLRRPVHRCFRCFAFAYLLLLPVFIAEGGKAYYMAGLYPVALAAGAIATDRWIGTHRNRRTALLSAITLTGAVSAVIGLAVLPVRDLAGSIVQAVNPDAGETVGWPRFVATVAHVFDKVPSTARGHTVIFTSNYGEAGAVALFGPAHGLPYPFSGHNGWTFWGPPPAQERIVVAVGLDTSEVNEHFTGCSLRARVDDGLGLENQEQGDPVWLCTGERSSWERLWPSLRHYD